MAGRPRRAASGGAPPGRPPEAPARAPDDHPPDGHVLLGEFGRAHGLRGEVRLKSYTADPADVAGYGPLVTAGGRAVTIRSVRPSGAAPDLLVARVEGVEDRDAAEALNRLAVFAHRDRLGPVGDADEFFAADLVGLSVVDGGGALIGSVVAVPNYGGGDLLEIRPATGGPTALLPFLKSFVPTIDLAAGRVVVDPPEDLFAPARPEPDA